MEFAVILPVLVLLVFGILDFGHAVGRIEIVHVAADAGRAGQAEIVVHVALRALEAGMRARQREPGSGVIELRAHPLHRRVAYRAILREGARHVVGSIGLLEILHMAAHALERRVGKIAVRVALRAGHRLVCAGERETAQVVIERSVLPGGRGVAGVARGGKVRGPMIWIRSVREVLHVAARAGRRRSGESVPHMALRAGHAGVRTREGEGGERVVIERSPGPRRGSVAQRAVLRERGVAGILCARKIFGVTANTLGRRAGELIPHVALRAGQAGMRSGERKVRRRERGVVETGALPGVHRMAGLTGRRQPGS